MDDATLRAWLRLIRTPGFGAAAWRKLAGTAGDLDPAALFRYTAARLRAYGITEGAADALVVAPDEEALDRDLEWLHAAARRHLLPLTHPRFPARLREIPDPPLALFAAGDLDLLDSPQVAIVGSRNPSPGGRRSAHDFARYLASAGLVITSGLAEGIDGAAHEGALAGDGMTLAVAGTGPDRVYPAVNRDLAHRIVGSGLLVTEFPPGTGPRPGHFPRRNRIISALSLGVLVVEAAERSGSLITARLANEYGREVFAIPGSIHNPLARGCHRLIRQGAKLVEAAADILEELGPLLTPATAVPRPPEGTTPPALDSDYRALVDVMGYDPVGMDVLAARSGLTPAALSSMLLILELKGYVSAFPGGRYSRSGPGAPS
jgi:DNA processing protein